MKRRDAIVPGLWCIPACAMIFLHGCGTATIAATEEIGPAEVDDPDEWYFLNDPSQIGHDSSGHGLDALPVGLSLVPDAVRGYVGHFVGGCLVIVPKMQRDFTIAFWLKTTQLGPDGTGWANGPRIVDADVPGVHLDFGLSLSLDKLSMGTGTPGDATEDALALKSQTAVSDGTWHHVAIMRDGAAGLWSIYVDGKADASRSGVTGPLTIPSTITLGVLGTTSPVTPNLDAALSDVRLYSRVLSPAALSFLATQ